MIKSIDKIIEEGVPSTSIKMWKSYNKALYKGLYKAIKEYGESIVDECANVVMATRPDTSTQDITEVKDRIV